MEIENSSVIERCQVEVELWGAAILEDGGGLRSESEQDPCSGSRRNAHNQGTKKKKKSQCDVGKEEIMGEHTLHFY